MVWMDNGLPQAAKCSPLDVLNHLKKAGLSEEEIDQGRQQIEENGLAVLHLPKLLALALQPALILPDGYAPSCRSSRSSASCSSIFMKVW